MRNMTRKSLAGSAIGSLFLCLIATQASYASTTCTFTTVGTTMTLDADCTTDTTIPIPDGYTLDGNGFTITAVDPSGDHFRGAVVTNAGGIAHVEHLTVNASGLANVCDGGADRLRGIMFDGASGTIAHNVVMNINQGPSGCQEGNAIEVRNAPYDGTHPATQTVEIFGNKITDYQKTGIVANGDVAVSVDNNQLSASATQANLAANGIQLGFGATGSVHNNNVDGNQWCGPSAYVATAILVYAGGDNIQISHNNIRGNSDVGIHLEADNVIVDNNRIFDGSGDCNQFGYDYGLGNWGSNNLVTNNKARGFDIPYDGVTEGKNKIIPRPHD